MTCSPARLEANRLNGSRSKGPTTPEGKAISRQNGLKHGLTGKGIVTPEGDAEEIRSRAEALEADMKPRSSAGLILIMQMATLSLRAERAAEQESATIARNVRHAADDFDEKRIDLANELFEALGENPRNNLRKLRKSPEGVDRLIDAWRDLRADLAIEPRPVWTAAHLEQAANMTGVKTEHARGSRLGAMSRGFWGDFAALGDCDGGDLGEVPPGPRRSPQLDELEDGEGGDLDEEFRRGWAKAMLFERIDAEIAGLEAHRETLDFELIAIDRAEAGARALFDTSRDSCLARRYESEASRGFYKALKEFRIVEAEFKARSESAPTLPEPSRTEARMGSSRETPPPPDREPTRAVPAAPPAAFPPLLDRDGQPSRTVSPTKKPG